MIAIEAPSVVGRRTTRDLVCGEQEIWLFSNAHEFA